MKAYVTAFAAALALGSWATQAHATVTLAATPSTTTSSNGLMSSYNGVTTITFDGSTALPAGFSGGTVVQGNSGGQYAAPNGDTSNFYAVGGAPSYTGTSTFTPGGVYTYFGLYWGSIDAYNTIAFTLAGATVASYTGSSIPPANGSMTAANTNEFVDFLFTGGSAYDKVTFSTTTANFELDNVAYGNLATTAVPEPASLALLGTGLLGVVGLVRRRKQAGGASLAA